MATCSISDCGKAARARGWCVMHYRRWRLYGDVNHLEQIRGDDTTRFWSKVDRRSPTECWPWLGATDRDGYGRMRLGKTHVRAARMAYELEVGPIAPGLVIDHVWARGCTRRDCVNPAHLEPVSNAENTRRSEPARREYCPAGHDYTPENTSYSSGTGRTCVTCNRERVRRRRANTAASVPEAS